MRRRARAWLVDSGLLYRWWRQAAESPTPVRRWDRVVIRVCGAALVVVAIGGAVKLLNWYGG